MDGGGRDANDDHDDFAGVAAYLRTLGEPCAPPVGIGTFEVLFVSAAEVGVWYSPARDGQRAGERVIPAPALAAAWARLRAGGALDEAALATLAGSTARGRWLLALLALLPGVAVEMGEPPALRWAPSVSAPVPVDAPPRL